jgi:hypothetical protein
MILLVRDASRMAVYPENKVDTCACAIRDASID